VNVERRYQPELERQIRALLLLLVDVPFHLDSVSTAGGALGPAREGDPSERRAPSQRREHRISTDQGAALIE
jgi:hypothetical protein